MKSGFLNLLVFISIICVVYFNSFDINHLFASISAGAGFLFIAFHFLSHHYDFTKKVNQVYMVACLLMFLPAVLQNINVPEQGYQTIFSLFYGFSFVLILLVFWLEDNAKEYNRSFLFLRISFFLAGFSLVNFFSIIQDEYRTMVSIIMGLSWFVLPSFFLRWKYQNTRNFRFGIVAGLSLITSLFLTSFTKNEGQFLPIGPLEMISYYLISVPFIKEKVLPNWLVLRFRNTEKTKRRIRRRERFRYKRAMEQENN